MNAPRPRPRRLLADRTGSVGLEMALVTPIIMLILLGFHETYMYVRSVGMVERAAATAANTMSRQLSRLVDCADTTSSLNLGTYVLAATLVAQPIDLVGSGQVILSAVDWPVNTLAPRVVWQRRSTFNSPNGISSLGRQGQFATLPAGLAAAITQGNDTVLVAEVFYRFTPFAMTASFWPNHPGVVTVHRTAFFRARTANLGTLAIGCTTAVLPTPPA